ncbi:TonB-dependent receptor plug domain-containing protein [Polaribacter sp.]|uniref:TonB-dependent receptor plug domain-containing protein n=1 Tax=Polaribacter sp. TaxID=1920175 RepID=UPI003F6AB043
MKFLIAVFFTAISYFSFAQEKTKKLISLDSIPATEAFTILEKEFNVKFSYTDIIIKGKNIFFSKKKRRLQEVLDELSEQINIDFEFINNRFIIVTQKTNLNFFDATNTLEQVLIKSYLAKGIVKDKNGAFKLRPKELEILPGLIEADVLENLQELPGVVSPNETATGLNVRGGTPDQNQIIWDGITIYHSGHLFGMVSNFNPNITNKILFLHKGINPKYGERIASVINISTTNAVAKNLNLGFGFNGISGDIFIDTPIIKDKLSVLVSFRKSYHSFFETGPFEKMEEKVFQSTQIHSSDNSDEIFYFKDQTVKLNYTFNKKNRISASFIHIDNDLEHFFENVSSKENYKDILDTENNGFSINWRKKWTSNTQQTTTFSASNFTLNYNFITYNNNQKDANFHKENLVKNQSISTEINTQLPSGNSALFGFQSVYKDVGYSFTETTDLKYILDKKRNHLNTYSLFASYSNNNFSFFDYNLGVRTNYYRELNQFRIEPRVSILKEVFKNLKLQLTADVRNQTTSQIDETLISNLSLENKLWRISDGKNAPIINSKQMTLGFLFDNKGWSFDVDTYYKKNEGISALKLGFFSNNTNNYIIGEQNIYGIDLYLKKNFHRIKSWISYSFTDIKNEFETLNNEEYFTASNQIQHAISSSLAYKTKKIQFALGWKWHSGKPYTLSETNATNTIFNQGINTGRLPNYNRFDFSSIFHFSFSKNNEIKGKLGVSIRNLLNQNNLISREYIGNNIPNDVITAIDKYSLKRTTNFVFRFEW